MERASEKNTIEEMIQPYAVVNKRHYANALANRQLLVSELAEIAFIGVFYQCEAQSKMILRYLENIGHHSSARLGYAVLSACEKNYDEAFSLIKKPFNHKMLEKKRKRFVQLLLDERFAGPVKK